MVDLEKYIKDVQVQTEKIILREYDEQVSIRIFYNLRKELFEATVHAPLLYGWEKYLLEEIPFAILDSNSAEDMISHLVERFERKALANIVKDRCFQKKVKKYIENFKRGLPDGVGIKSFLWDDRDLIISLSDDNNYIIRYESLCEETEKLKDPLQDN